ncbi:rhomboid family intramembrane serine protease [Butyrivibrio sp. INlla21]|uniref:rhomboid family intramembrane serine protease n=1 Tax=Butyrivibrio sp. INlla21 TaxID=1520811 RepID=UPI0008E9B8E3|nr:rhomboid family intramembrane serine protease [Butyrivibrio sp. INlla21]SFU61900.1 rhomboid protease GluP [Butyrivibrio sp. INlla21]
MEDTQNRDFNNVDDFWNKQSQIYKTAYVSIAILALNVLVFIACLANTSIYDIGIMATDWILSRGEWYRFITSMFLHADLNHLFSNMLMLVLAGGIVEKHSGHLYYGIMFFASGIVGNVLSMMYEIVGHIVRYSLGASGGTMGIVGYLAFWIFANKKGILKNRNLLFRIVFLTIFIIDSCFFQEGANTVAHLGGFITGFIMGYINIVIMNNNKDMEGLA